MNVVELPLPGRAVARREAVELGHVALERAGHERGRAVGEGGAGRQVRVDVLDAAPRQLVAELGVGRRAGEERVPRGHHLVREPGHGEVVDRPDAAAGDVVPLEHAHRPALARQQRGARRAS